MFDHFFVTVQAVIDGLRLGIGPLPVLEADKTTSLARFIEWLRIEGAG